MIGDRMLKSFARKLVDRIRNMAKYYQTNSDRGDSHTISTVLAVMAVVIEQVAEIGEDKQDESADG
jgi:hypothetical protein